MFNVFWPPDMEPETNNLQDSEMHRRGAWGPFDGLCRHKALGFELCFLAGSSSIKQNLLKYISIVLRKIMPLLIPQGNAPTNLQPTVVFGRCWWSCCPAHWDIFPDFQCLLFSDRSFLRKHLRQPGDIVTWDMLKRPLLKEVSPPWGILIACLVLVGLGHWKAG